jgi:hypothetical protein
MEPVLYLEETRDAFVATCGELSREQARKPIREGGWSAAGFAEHLATAERGILIRLKKALGEAAATSEALAETAGKTELILNHVPAAARAAESPEMLRPSERYGDWPGPYDAFLAARASLIEFARQTDPAALASIVSPHPMLGPFTGTQWLYFCGAHLERHRRQIAAAL